MALSFNIENLDFILKITSGNINSLLKSEIFFEATSTETIFSKEDILKKIIDNLILIKKNLTWETNKEFHKLFNSNLKYLVNEKLSLEAKEETIRYIARLFTKYFPLKVFIISGNNQKYTNKTFLNNLMRKINNKHILVLQCNDLISDNTSIKNAFYKYKDLYLNLNSEPGLFFYTRDYGFFYSMKSKSIDEISTFISRSFNFEEFEYLSKNLVHYKTKEKSVNKLIKEAKSLSKSAQNILTIFHLSDLHLGSSSINEDDKKLLLNKIKNDMTDNNIFFITGDLINNPNDDHIAQLTTFLKDLKLLSKSNDIYMVNGNHDCRLSGFISIKQKSNLFSNIRPTNKKSSLSSCYSTLQKIINYNSNVIYLEKYKLLLIKIDSCKEHSNLATGRIGDSQLNNLSQKIKNFSDKSLTKFALLHHHLNSSGNINSLKESTLLLKDSNNFVNWATKHNINYICHGHEHIARNYHLSNIPIISADTAFKKIPSINYNILTFDLNSRMVTQTMHLTYPRKKASYLSKIKNYFSVRVNFL